MSEPEFGKRSRFDDVNTKKNIRRVRGRIGDEEMFPCFNFIEKGEDIEIEYDSWDMFERLWEKSQTRLDDHDIMWRCLQFCYLFPKNYEFHKDDLIHLWIAQGFIPLSPMFEDTDLVVGCRFFDEFEGMQIFQVSRLDCSTGRLRYRLNHSIVDLLQQQHHDEYCRIGDSYSHLSQNTLHFSLPDTRIMDPITLNVLYQAKGLCTLLLHHEHGSHLDQVPRHLFLELPLLNVLDLSHTSIADLPSSIGKLKKLRYLNLSGTPITTLPNSLCNLYQMQTLKLRGCLNLVCLPNGMRKLINLRHLDLDLACLLVSMPPGFGDLTQLQSLLAFVVGKENGCHITELKHMVNLGGSLRVLRLENVSVPEEAKEAALDKKKYLHKLELQWTQIKDGFEILENLQPHINLQELQIVRYGCHKFPSWIGDPIFSKLMTITIHDCRKCELLPPLGRLPFLHDLCISEMHEIKVIDHEFCGRNMDKEILDLERLELGPGSEDLSNANMFKAFPRLEKLSLDAMPNLEKWSGVEEGDFPHLQKLNISGCSKLFTFPELSSLKSLQQLEISLCPLLEFFPNGGLSTSLQYLVIIDCPLLKKWCHMEEEQDCGMLAHIPHVWIDYQQIFQLSNHTPNMEMEQPNQITPKNNATRSIPLQTSDTEACTEQALQLEGQVHVEDTGSHQLLEGEEIGAFHTEGAHNHLKPHPSRQSELGYPLSLGEVWVIPGGSGRSIPQGSKDNTIGSNWSVGGTSSTTTVTESFDSLSHFQEMPSIFYPSRQSVLGSELSRSEVLETGEASGSYAEVRGNASRNNPHGSKDNKVSSDWRVGETSSTSAVTEASYFQGMHSRFNPSRRSVLGSELSRSEVLGTGEASGSYAEVPGDASRNIAQGSEDNKVSSDWSYFCCN